MSFRVGNFDPYTSPREEKQHDLSRAGLLKFRLECQTDALGRIERLAKVYKHAAEIEPIDPDDVREYKQLASKEKKLRDEVQDITNQLKNLNHKV